MKTLKLTLAFTDLTLDPEEQDEKAQRLIAELEDMDEVEQVGRVPDPISPEGSKSFGGFLVGLLMAEVSIENGKKLIAFLAQRLGNQPIEIALEFEDKKLSVKASSQAEVEFAFQKAQEFIARSSSKSD